MKKILMMGVAALAGLAMTAANAITLDEVAAKKSDVAAKPATAGEVIKSLSSAEDQVKFLAMVNEAIAADTSLTPAQRTAKYIAATTSALASCPAANIPALMAEAYATIPLQSLPYVSESLTTNVFARGEGTTDAQMKAAAESVMEAIESRTATASDADRRNTAAVLAFLNASGGTPEDLRSTLLDGYPAAAAQEWVPAAMGEVDGSVDYDPLLGEKVEGFSMDELRNALASMEIASGDGSAISSIADGSTFEDVKLEPDAYTVPTPDPIIDSDGNINDPVVPRTLNPDKPWSPEYRRGDTPSYPTPDEPTPYPDQY